LPLSISTDTFKISGLVSWFFSTFSNLYKERNIASVAMIGSAFCQPIHQLLSGHIVEGICRFQLKEILQIV